MSFNFLDEDLDDLEEHQSLNTTDPVKKVDKLGRVRPSNYVNKKQPSKKKKKQELNVDDGASCVAGNIISENEDDDQNVLEHFNLQENMVQKEDTVESVPADTLEPTDFTAILGKIIENADSELFQQNEDDVNTDNLISDDKWEELIDFTDIIEEEVNESEKEKNDAAIEKEATIYPGHHMTVYTSMVLLLLYSMCHNTSSAELSDLLTIVSLHCLHPHPGLKSIYVFKHFFSSLQSPLKKHFYCTNCMCDVTANTEICPNTKCLKPLNNRKGKSFFIEMPVENQLKKILERKGIIELLGHRFSRSKKRPDAIEDIYDGNIYKSMAEHGGPLSEDNPYNVSFTWNTDGIPIFKSSKVSIWPFYLSINELPPKQRMLTENMIMYGLWFGESKPFMAGFTKPLSQVLKNLETKGIDFEHNGETHNSKGYLLCGTADLPAKSLVLNCNQFNGEYSCLRCLHSGETFKTSKGGSVRTFPFDISKLMSEERTTEGCIKDSIDAIQTKTVKNGIKGPSFLMTLGYYDFVKSSSIDYMHGVLLGISKVLINLWTGGSNSKINFSISTSINIIDERLKKIKPPSFISRTPRTISNHLKYWKASELRSWLFFYSLPILGDLLPSNYLFHYACFVEGIFLLCKDSISEDDLKKSKTMLSYFVHMFPSMYSQRFVTLNMHSLLHLPQCVHDLGPLWTYSCFPFESANGVLTELFHGTQNIELQIISSLNILQNMSNLLLPIQDPVHRSFAEKLKHTPVSNTIYAGTLSGCFPIGNKVDIKFCDVVYGKLMTEINYQPSQCYCFHRIHLRGQVLHSAGYSRVFVRNTYTVKYYDSEKKNFSYGSISYFILAKSCTCKSHICNCTSSLVAVLTLFEEVKPSLLEPNFLSVTVNHIKVVRKTNIVKVIDTTKIVSVVINIDFNEGEQFYLSEVPNLKESD